MSDKATKFHSIYGIKDDNSQQIKLFLAGGS